MIDRWTFNRDEIEFYLSQLGAELHKHGMRAEMFIVGGAAITLAYDTERATQDVDAVFEPKHEVYDAAARVARRYDIPDDWLNDSVKGFLPAGEPEYASYFEIPGISVKVASPQYLLALKVAAARVERDQDDIKFLAETCGLRSAEEILSATEETIGPLTKLLPKAQFLIAEMFPEGVATDDGSESTTGGNEAESQ